MRSDPSFNYSITFWLYPRGPAIENWGSIFHYGDVDSVRAPAVWTLPGTYGLHCVLDAVSRSNMATTTPALTQNVWGHIALSVNTNKMLVYQNGLFVGQSDMTPHGGRKAYPTQKFYGGDNYPRTCRPWFTGGDCESGCLTGRVLTAGPLCRMQRRA